jgi:hypothetical protein
VPIRDRARLMKEARSVEHLCTHIPKNPFCPSCQKAKAQRRHARDKKKSPEAVLLGPPPKEFADEVTCDHLTTLAEEDIGIDKSRVALACKDRGTGYGDVYPTGTKSAEETRRSISQFWAGTRANASGCIQIRRRKLLPRLRN